MLLAARVAGGGAAVAVAQGAPHARMARVDSLAAAGDSTSALAVLDSIVRREPRNAPAWHRRGMIAWSMARPQRRAGFMRDMKAISLIRMADTSLRLAVIHAPDSGGYATDVGRFLLNSGLSTTRWAAIGFVEKALDVARRTGDSAAISRAADELGMVYWRRYEAVANRVLLTGVSQVALDGYADDPKGMDTYLESLTRQQQAFSGENDYLRATELFGEALRTDASNAAALRHTYMSLADQKRWEELRRAAAARLSVAPLDAQSRMALGLASHRLNRPGEAAVAFDSALVLLPDSERSRLTRLSRILRRSDSASIAARSDGERRMLENVFWAMSDPLWITPGNENWLEFLSRIAYAELLWTSDDLDLRGADTDRGEIHVRFGPAPVVLGFPPDASGIGSVAWRYPADGVSFVFRTPPTYGSATFSGDYRDFARRSRERMPVRWSNVPIHRAIDSITVQVTRFRGTADSMDVALFAELPLARMGRGLDVARVPVQIAFTHLDGHARVLVHDSAQVTVDLASHDDTAAMRAWRRRVSLETSAYRVEAYQPGAQRGARAVGVVLAALDSGFGASDLLVAERVTAREGTAAARWTDVFISPSVGRLRRGQSFSLLWETYGLAPRDGANRYRVEVALVRTDGGRLARLVTRVLSGTPGPMQASARGRQRVALAFTREVPARDISLDYLTLDLAGAPAGRYRLTVTVTDLVTPRSVSRDRELVIIE